MFANAIATGFRVETQSNGLRSQVDPPAQLKERFKPDSKSTNLIASLGGTARVQQCNDPTLIKGGTSIGGFQSVAGKAHTDPAVRLISLENRVGSVLDKFVELTIRISPRKHLILSLEVLRRIPRLSLVGPQTFLAFNLNELGQLFEHGLFGADIHCHFKLLIENMRLLSSRSPVPYPRE